MICVYCGERPLDVENHYADCHEAPEFVSYQGKAERRAAFGGELAPNIPPCVHEAASGMDWRTRNQIDRGEPTVNAARNRRKHDELLLG